MVIEVKKVNSVAVVKVQNNVHQIVYVIHEGEKHILDFIIGNAVLVLKKKHYIDVKENIMDEEVFVDTVVSRKEAEKKMLNIKVIEDKTFLEDPTIEVIEVDDMFVIHVLEVLKKGIEVDYIKIVH